LGIVPCEKIFFYFRNLTIFGVLTSVIMENNCQLLDLGTDALHYHGDRGKPSVAGVFFL